MNNQRQSCSPQVLALVLLMFASITANAAYRFDEPDTFLADAENWPAWFQTYQQHLADRDAIRLCIENEDACSGRMKSLRHVRVRGEMYGNFNQVLIQNIGCFNRIDTSQIRG